MSNTTVFFINILTRRNLYSAKNVNYQRYMLGNRIFDLNFVHSKSVATFITMTS